MENQYCMRHIIRNITKQDTITFAILIVFALIVWFAGPSLVIANHLPLLEPEKRFGVIMILVLGWLLLSLIYSTPEKAETISELSADIAKKFESLQGRFHGAIEFLQKTVVNKNGENISLATLPWYVFIGPKNSGKTSLLANSTLNFILAKQFKPEIMKNIPTSEICDWWVTRDLVLVDIPSHYTRTVGKVQKNMPRNSIHNLLWNNLLTLIQAHKPLNGVVVAINLPELMKHHHSQQLSTVRADIKYSLLEARERFGKETPCYIVITKCDLIPGFKEFFAESTTDELAQSWGITLSSLGANEKLSDVLFNRFNALIKRLNKQLIWRLHQERNPQARTLIKDFPLYMERIKENTIEFIKSLGFSDLCLNGIFFTSAIQQDDEESSTTNSALTINQTHALQLLQEQPITSKPYFVRQLISQALLHHNEIPTPQLNTATPSWESYALYAAAAAAITVTALFLGHDFVTGVEQAYSIQNKLAQYQIYLQQPDQQNDHLMKSLPLLNSLQEAAEAVNNNHFSSLASHLAFYSKKSQHTANQVYIQALQNIVLPGVRNTLEKYLQNPNEKNPVQLYAVLKAYLMLTGQQPIQVEFVASTVKTLLASSSTDNIAAQLTNHLSAALRTNAKPITADESLIAQARKQLVSVTSVDLAYVILKNMNDNNSTSAIKIGTDNDSSTAVFVSKDLANQIPTMFTASGYKAILAGEINVAASEATQGNVVLGAINPTQNSTTVADQLRTQYIANYIDIWESQLANIKLNSPKNFVELNSMLRTITSDNSPLLQMLQTIQKNTAFDTVMSASPKLQTLNMLLGNANNNQSNLLYQMFVSFKQLHSYTDNLSRTPDIGNATFQASVQHLQKLPNDPITQLDDLAQQVPEPMKSWLTSMSAQSWSLISTTASHFVDTQWQKTIMPAYHNDIADHFPFARNASQDVNLSSFTKFMGQQGMLASFYQTYLRPFIDDSQPDWHWRDGDHKALPFKDDVLAQLQQAVKIQHAFFPNGDNQLYVQFSLQPVALTPDAKTFNLTINGQQVNYQKNDPTTARVVAWPGNNNTSHTTSINFMGLNNQLTTRTVQGDWAWFRLVDKATQNVNTRKEIALKLDVDGKTADFLLFTQGHFNPFLPLNLEKLQLPESLV